MRSNTGSNNPNWKGGKIKKTCLVCDTIFYVRRGYKSARFCSLKCVGISQRGVSRPSHAKVTKTCIICSKTFALFQSHSSRSQCCSRKCQGTWRSSKQSGEGNPNWRGGISRKPYPWNFREISRRVIERDGGICNNPTCERKDERMTTHHIDYDKQNCDDANLIALCSACNSKANFNRKHWKKFYCQIMEVRI